MIIFQDGKFRIELYDSVEELKKQVNYGPLTKEETEARADIAKAISSLKD